MHKIINICYQGCPKMVLRLKDMKFLEMSIIRRDNRYSTVQIEYRTDSEWCWDICKNVAFKFSWNIVYGQKYNAVLTLKDKQTIQDVSINEMFFKKLAFRHAGACLTLLRKIWEEWQKERKKEWKNERQSLGLFTIRLLLDIMLRFKKIITV